MPLIILAGVMAAVALSEFEAVDSDAAAKRNVRSAIESVAARLGNTPTICRKCYVHPEILQCYIEGQLVETLKSRIETELSRRLAELSAAEAATLALLHRRLNGTRAKKTATTSRRAPLNGSNEFDLSGFGRITAASSRSSSIRSKRRLALQGLLQVQQR